MGVLQLLGVGRKQLLARGRAVQGTVVSAKACWWIKVNQKPLRGSALDGAAFPHVIAFRYTVDGVERTGRAWVAWNQRCPQPGEAISVYCDGDRPGRCAVKLSATKMP